MTSLGEGEAVRKTRCGKLCSGNLHPREDVARGQCPRARSVAATAADPRSRAWPASGPDPPIPTTIFGRAPHRHRRTRSSPHTLCIPCLLPINIYYFFSYVLSSSRTRNFIYLLYILYYILYILGCQISPFRFFPLYSMLYKKCYSDRI